MVLVPRQLMPAAMQRGPGESVQEPGPELLRPRSRAASAQPTEHLRLRSLDLLETPSNSKCERTTVWVEDQSIDEGGPTTISR